MVDISEIYQYHAQTVYRYLLSLTQDPHLAEELTQETFCQAIKGVGKFRGESQISTWLCSIAKRQLAQYQRRHPPTVELSEQLPSGMDPEREVLDGLGYMALLKRLHSLNEPYREVMYLRLFGDLSFANIGEILGKTENWARVTYYRGKEKLRKELLEDEAEL